MRRAGQLDKAKRLYAELIEKHPQHRLIAPATEQLAEAAYDAGDAAWSAELFSRLAAAGSSRSTRSKAGLGWHGAGSRRENWPRRLPLSMKC